MIGLPKGWLAPVLDDVVVFNPGHALRPSPGTPVSFVPMPAVSDTAGEIVSPTVRPFADVSKGYTQFQEGDVIFAKITPCMENGKIAVARSLESGVACGSTEFHVVRPLGGVSPDYVWRFLRQKSFRGDAEASMTGAVGQRRVPAAFLKQHRLPLPPLPEQRRIVAKIGSLSAKSVRARDRLDHIPRLVEKYKKAMLTAAFRGELTREWRSKQTAAGGWRGVLTGDLVSWSSGKNLPTKKQSAGTIPVIGGNGISGYHDQALITHDTVVIGRVGAQCGNVHLSTGPAWITDNAIYARAISGELDPRYAVLLLRTKDLNRLAGGTGQPYVNQAILNAVEFELPPLSEQQEILRLINTACTWIDRLANEATSARKLVDHFDQAVLAKAFRGELVPQDPNDEPASVLLERIRAEREGMPARTVRRGRRAAG